MSEIKNDLRLQYIIDTIQKSAPGTAIQVTKEELEALLKLPPAYIYDPTAGMITITNESFSGLPRGQERKDTEALWRWRSADTPTEANAISGTRHDSDKPRNGITESQQEAAGIHKILAERGSRYGSFSGHANITQRLKKEMALSHNWHKLSDSQKEALEMVAHKIGRILNGDPQYLDSWVDIVGYTQLVVDQLNGKNT